MLFKILFYIFAAITIYSAVRVVSAKNTMTSVLHLILTFVMTSCLWMLLQAEFLALALIIIYCGAVMVFFLFAVMMLDIPEEALKSAGNKKYIAVGLIVAVVFVAEIIAITTGSESLLRNPEHFSAIVGEDPISKFGSNPKDLGFLLYTEYLYSFEVVAMVLLVSMIAAISLTRRTGPLRRKEVDVSWQIRQNAEDRMRVVSMPASKMAEYVEPEEAPVLEESDEAAEGDAVTADAAPADDKKEEK